MDNQDEKKKGLSRRDFMKTAVAGAGVVALAGLPGQVQAVNVKTVRKWHEEADVVIVGFGGAGANAAIAAHDAGAKVLLLEKLPEGLEGGNTTSTGSGTVHPWNIEKAIEHEYALGMGTTPKEYMEAYIKTIDGVLDWYDYLGLSYVKGNHDYSHYFCSSRGQAGPESRHESGLDQYLPKYKGMSCAALFTCCLDNVKKRGIKVLYETPGKQLITNPSTGEVVGVVAEQAGKQLFIKAKKAVILTCGGYENNPEMVAQFNYPGYHFYPAGTPGNTGDGIVMSMSVGAAIWHMTGMEVQGYGVRPIKDGPAKNVGLQFAVSNGSKKGAYAIVNRFGKRFYNETKRLSHSRIPTLPSMAFDGWCDDRTSTNSYLNQPAYLVFDETFRRQGPLITTIMGYPIAKKLYEWSSDNSKEVASGLITKADSIEELGKKLGIDAKELSSTVAAYNKAGAVGDDPVFGRPQKSIMPIKNPPFYGCSLDMLFINTQGGPMHRSDDAKVLDTQGKHIPRLYAAGELGSVWGWMYHGSGNIPEAVMVGRVAGINAAAEKPWK